MVILFLICSHSDILCPLLTNPQDGSVFTDYQLVEDAFENTFVSAELTCPQEQFLFYRIAQHEVKIGVNKIRHQKGLLLSAARLDDKAAKTLDPFARDADVDIEDIEGLKNAENGGNKKNLYPIDDNFHLDSRFKALRFDTALLFSHQLATWLEWLSPVLGSVTHQPPIGRILRLTCDHLLEHHSQPLTQQFQFSGQSNPGQAEGNSHLNIHSTKERPPHWSPVDGAPTLLAGLPPNSCLTSRYCYIYLCKFICLFHVTLSHACQFNVYLYGFGISSCCLCCCFVN
ncbi:unnamed protein product [Protopolystoma xenopodis]|uniref:Uncharacterized protein n=1 Tax=Protopolystoma xenopodis TaxID=117903 RepID=A0A3S5CTN8_9PLAT|nr:unnamed protein product [Protopolystoma xenopodis]